MSYKDAIQARAMDAAWEKYDKDFYELTDQQQFELYDEAMHSYTESRIP